MKIFAIRDAGDRDNKDIAYLFYYEKGGRFYVELPADADPWETPLILSSFLKRGEKTINSYWSRVWVQQRIVPADRQNIGQILRDNGLKEYDECRLLELSEGRCPQDNCYIAPVSEAELPAEFVMRFGRKVEDVIPLAGKNLLVFFRDGSVKKCSLYEMLGEDRTFAPILNSDDQFNRVRLQPGGHGACWGESLNIPYETLYAKGEAVPLSADDFISFVEHRVINTAEVMNLLNCTRQNIDDLVRREKLHPIKQSAKNRFFLRSEVEERMPR